MQKPKRLRVLFVPDMLPWVTGTIAQQVARWNPWIEPTICSTLGLRWYVQQTRQLPEVDVVHLLTEYEAQTWSAIFQGRAAVVHSIHHVEDWDFIQPYTRCDAIHVIANQWRDYLAARGVANSRMVSMTVGVDADVFALVASDRRRQERKKLELSDDAFVVGFCAKKTSNSSGRKAPEVFIEGMRRLAGKVPGAAALIVGPGWSEVVRQFRAEGIKAIWLPFIEDHGDLAALYRSMDVYWVTSRIEGGPVPLLEAMSCGTPCVSTRVGVAEEVIEHGGNGFLVPFDDPDAFVDMTRGMAGDRRQAVELGRRARETILAGWQWKQSCPSAADLYATAVANFTQAAGSVPPLDIAEAVRAHCVNPPDTLSAIPAHLKEPLRVHEHRMWVGQLQRMGEHRAARRYALHVLGERASSSQRWSLVLDAFEFQRTVAAARWLKGLILARSSQSDTEAEAAIAEVLSGAKSGR